MTQKPGLARGKSSARGGEAAARRRRGVGGEGRAPGPAAARPRRRRGESRGGGCAEGGGRAPPRPCSHLADQLLPEGGAPPVGLLPRNVHAGAPLPPPAPRAAAAAASVAEPGPTRKPSAAPRPRRKRSGDCGKRARARLWEMESRAPHGPPRAPRPAARRLARLARGPAACGCREPRAAAPLAEAARSRTLSERMPWRHCLSKTSAPARPFLRPHPKTDHTLVLSVRLLEFHFPPMALFSRAWECEEPKPHCSFFSTGRPVWPNSPVRGEHSLDAHERHTTVPRGGGRGSWSRREWTRG